MLSCIFFLGPLNKTRFELSVIRLSLFALSQHRTFFSSLLYVSSISLVLLPVKYVLVSSVNRKNFSIFEEFFMSLI